MPGMDAFIQWIVENKYDALSSFLGLGVTIIGFGITIFNVVKSKSAARSAEFAANKALASVKYFDIVEALSRAISIVEEIQRLNRAAEWKVLLDRHINFRSMVISIKGQNINLNESQQSILQSSIQHSATMSHKIETFLENNRSPTGVATMNKILSELSGRLGSLLIEIRDQNNR